MHAAKRGDETADADLRKLLDIVERFRSARQTLSIGQVSVFLRVAIEEGLTVNDYAKSLGMAQSMMSRTLLDLSETPRGGSPGLGLLLRKHSATSLRDVNYFLSPKGRYWVQQMHETMRRR